MSATLVRTVGVISRATRSCKGQQMTYLSASSSYPLAEVLRLLIEKIWHAQQRPPLEDPGLELHPDGARRGHPVPPKRLVGVEKAPDVPDIDLVEELQQTCVFATSTNS